VNLAPLAAHQIKVLQSLLVSLKEAGYSAVDQEITQIAINVAVTAKATAVASLKAVDHAPTVALQTVVHPAKVRTLAEMGKTVKLRIVLRMERTAKLRIVVEIQTKKFEHETEVNFSKIL